MEPGSAHSRLLRSTFLAGGAVAAGAGLHSTFAGLRSIPGRPSAVPSTDSELRYYSAFYVAQGVRMIRIGSAGVPTSRDVREAAAAVLLGGLGRILSWRQAGKPHAAQIALAAVELFGPPAVLILERRG